MKSTFFVLLFASIAYFSYEFFLKSSMSSGEKERIDNLLAVQTSDSIHLVGEVPISQVDFKKPSQKHSLNLASATSGFPFCRKFGPLGTSVLVKSFEETVSEDLFLIVESEDDFQIEYFIERLSEGKKYWVLLPEFIRPENINKLNEFASFNGLEVKSGYKSLSESGGFDQYNNLIGPFLSKFSAERVSKDLLKIPITSNVVEKDLFIENTWVKVSAKSVDLVNVVIDSFNLFKKKNASLKSQNFAHEACDPL